MCGGTRLSRRLLRRSRGLSPRVRGNLRLATSRLSRYGSIPACAGEPNPAQGRLLWYTVYPRVCGGTGAGSSSSSSFDGLSPRVRGNPSGPLSPAASLRSIPACAGEPTIGRAANEPHEVYPRVCGGTSGLILQPSPVGGLSPRVRGNPTSSQNLVSSTRSIPACAGEPGIGRSRLPPSRVYPRVCGGTGSARPRTGRDKGLSPRVRGNPIIAAAAPTTDRSIPACAGEPSTARADGRERGVYPRVCGGTLASPLIASPTLGLSPRVRGNLISVVLHRYYGGSIPACAGEPHQSAAAARMLTVYPRVCGGTNFEAIDKRLRQGLSPRVRGNHHHDDQPVDPWRSIPACAGEPTPGVPRSILETVYPRVCGGTPDSSRRQTRVKGLSPRVRGNLQAGAAVTPSKRSIPACAGEPRHHGQPGRGHAVYPRVCGGTPNWSPNVRNARGLSPRVRGNLGIFDLPLCRCRSIPACAGEPGPRSRRRRVRTVYPRVCGGTVCRR